MFYVQTWRNLDDKSVNKTSVGKHSVMLCNETWPCWFKTQPPNSIKKLYYPNKHGKIDSCHSEMFHQGILLACFLSSLYTHALFRRHCSVTAQRRDGGCSPSSSSWAFWIQPAFKKLLFTFYFFFEAFFLIPLVVDNTYLKTWFSGTTYNLRPNTVISHFQRHGNLIN